MQGLGSQMESFTRVGRLPPRSPPLLDEGQPIGLNLIQIQKWSLGMWETSPPAAPLLLKERFDKTLVPLLSKERLGEVLPDHTKLQFST